MAENSSIAWTDHTFNPWQGCMKVSPGCAHCYAESLTRRFHPNDRLWGPNSQRKIASESYWQQPIKWNRDALKTGTRARVFVASMSDVFEDHPAVTAARGRLFEVIDQCTMLDWLLLTKRPENIDTLAPYGGALKPWPRNVWLGTSAETQEWADKRIPVLLDVPAAVRFVSYEPALGPIHWREEWTDLDWVIVGAESGAKRRPFDMAWALETRDWCLANGVAFFFKQNSASTPGAADYLVEADGNAWRWHQWPGDKRLPEKVEAVTHGA